MNIIPPYDTLDDMSITVVLEQMIMITLLIAMGFAAYKRGVISDRAGAVISALVANITNPCLMISSMLGGDERVSGKLLILGLLGAIGTYAILIVVAELLPRLFRIEKNERYSYFMLMLFGNTGFIGIPLASAVLGPESLVYVCFHNLIFSFLIYTIGINKISAAAAGKEGVPSERPSGWQNLKGMINTGTIAAVFALILYIAGLNLPHVLMLTIDYAGRSTTFLSMTVLGIAVAKMKPKRVIKHYRLIVMSLLRLTLIPVIMIYLLKLFIHDDLIIYTSALMLAVPAGNMPLILATKQGLDAETISDGIVLSTVMSIATIPIVTLFV